MTYTEEYFRISLLMMKVGLIIAAIALIPIVFRVFAEIVLALLQWWRGDGEG